MDLLGNTAAIWNSIVLNTYYGMLRAQIHTILSPEHPVIFVLKQWN